MPDSRTEIGELWHAVNREFHDRFRQAFRGHDMALPALMLLRHVDMEPGVTVNELARRLGIVKSHVSKMVDQLVQQGYVEKRTDPADARLLRIHVTEVARRVKAEMEARAQCAWFEVLNEVPKESLDEVARGLRILLNAMEKAKGR